MIRKKWLAVVALFGGSLCAQNPIVPPGVFAADAQPTEYCDRHVPGYYNTVTKQIVDGPGDNVIEVSVRQIPYREFFGRIYTKDQSYVVWSNQSGGNG